MKLFVGLGNPGTKYENTRHNVGFMFVEQFSHVCEASSFQTKSKFDADIAECTLDDEKVLFVKPQTFMNQSGIAVRKVMDFYNLSQQDITIAHDDLDITFGEFKIQNGKGPREHNGLISIEEHLGSADFNRIRIGIDNRNEEVGISGRDYVLSRFTGAEITALKEVFSNIISQLHG